MSAFSRGQLSQLGNKLEAAGWLPEDVANLGQAEIPRLLEIRDSFRRPVFENFFRTREGLWVSEDFRNRVATKAKARNVVPKTRHVDLARKMTDAQIETMLGEGHLFSEVSLCGLLEKMLSDQSDGKDGQLLNNGFANLFYTASSVVYVYWSAGYRWWYVSTWQRDDREWNASYRVFSLGN